MDGMDGMDGIDVDDADTRTLTFMNPSGDGTLAWGPDSDEVMRSVIEAKMKQGFAFFIVERRLGGLVRRKVRVTDPAKALASRSLTLSDAEFAAVVSSGAVQLVHTPSGGQVGGLAMGESVMSRDPAAIARSRSFAVRAMVGG